MWFLGLPYLGFLSYRGFVVRGGRVFEATFNYPMFITGLVIFALITWLVITQMIVRRIVIRADHEKICVHDRVYYWDRAQGFRLGYSVGGVERVDKVWKYQGIRMSYGPYGDDIPFMVHDFYAPIYVVLLNDLLQAVQPRSVADETAETGIKQVFF